MSDHKYEHIGSRAMHLLEECGELIQSVSKGERFGWFNRYPKGGPTNFEEFVREYGDVQKRYKELVEHIIANQGDAENEEDHNPPMMSFDRPAEF